MKDRTLLGGSLLAGLLASACCIGPLLLGALGLGSVGIASALAPLRPWFLGLTAILLAFGFYLAYRRPRAERCAPGEPCARPVERRAQRIALWVVATVAIGLAAYPSWDARFARAPLASPAVSAATTAVTLDVQGMTCSACEGEIERALAGVRGVVRAKADFGQSRAEVRIASAHTMVEPLVAAVERAGYRARLASR